MRTCLRYESGAISVEAEDAAELRWLVAFLDCGFEEDPGARAHSHVELRIDADAWEQLERRPPLDRPPVTGFAGDSTPLWLECRGSDGAYSVYRDARYPIYYRLSGRCARVEVVCHQWTRKVRTAWMRVVRELAMERIVASGGTLVHAAAVRTPAGVIAIAGPRRSGKTTLLLSLLQQPGGDYVANDRCVVRIGGDGARVRGLPTLVSIRADLMARHPQARARLVRLRPELAPVRGAGMARPRFSISPPELCEIVQAGRAPGGPLRALVFPRVTGGPQRLAVRRLEAGEALEHFRRGLFRASAATLLGDVFVTGAGAAEARSPLAAADGIDRKIASRVACFEASLGGGAPPGPEDCLPLLEALPSAPVPVTASVLHA